uniref:PHD-type domain-containing protein n=1 Tax=Caenorhabditis tropicalis TaxID=1561998 RepID=A0A1I7U5S3_9PELO
MEVDEEASTSTSQAKQQTKKKKRPRKRKTNDEEEEYAENKVFANQISQKFGSSKGPKQKDETPMFEVRNGKATIKNSGNHRQTVNRTLEVHMNKLFQWEEEADAIESAYVCALCHESGKKRELFGPYYISTSSIKHWPTFLAKKPTSKKESKLELWFHGSCILWAPNVHLHGSQLTNLEQQMDLFYTQNCTICKKNGAAISVQSKKNTFVHYPCAKNKAYKLDEHTLSCNS